MLSLIFKNLICQNMIFLTFGTGLGAGLITCLIRYFGSYPEGVSFAILFMNILTPYIDKINLRRPVGGVKNEK